MKKRLPVDGCPQNAIEINRFSLQTRRLFLFCNYDKSYDLNDQTAELKKLLQCYVHRATLLSEGRINRLPFGSRGYYTTIILFLQPISSLFEGIFYCQKIFFDNFPRYTWFFFARDVRYNIWGATTYAAQTQTEEGALKIEGAFFVPGEWSDSSVFSGLPRHIKNLLISCCQNCIWQHRILIKNPYKSRGKPQIFRNIAPTYYKDVGARSMGLVQTCLSSVLTCGLFGVKFSLCFAHQICQRVILLHGLVAVRLRSELLGPCLGH